MAARCPGPEPCGGGAVVPGSSTAPGTPGWQVILAGGSVNVIQDDDGNYETTYTVGNETVLASSITTPQPPTNDPDPTSPPPPPAPPAVVQTQAVVTPPPPVIAGSDAAGGDAVITPASTASTENSAVPLNSVAAPASHSATWAVWALIGLALLWYFFERK